MLTLSAPFLRVALPAEALGLPSVSAIPPAIAPSTKNRNMIFPSKQNERGHRAMGGSIVAAAQVNQTNGRKALGEALRRFGRTRAKAPSYVTTRPQSSPDRPSNCLSTGYDQASATIGVADRECFRPVVFGRRIDVTKLGERLVPIDHRLREPLLQFGDR